MGWLLEDSGYDVDELEHLMLEFFSEQGLPIQDESIVVKAQQGVGCVECLYFLPDHGLHYSFVLDFATRVSDTGALFVRDSGNGYGRKLEDARTKFCRRVGMTKMDLISVEADAEGFWEKMGYVNGMKTL
ncbi:hypothetical protein CEE44_04895 [Candidatus Woesearchaeota archaeon B3_Woes]|nr:MAG: hypothetical protein CEE44_04895 [Candidatus Woesearchaeota archaeon B3_Woes]